MINFDLVRGNGNRLLYLPHPVIWHIWPTGQFNSSQVRALRHRTSTFLSSQTKPNGQVVLVHCGIQTALPFTFFLAPLVWVWWVCDRLPRPFKISLRNFLSAPVEVPFTWPSRQIALFPPQSTLLQLSAKHTPPILLALTQVVPCGQVVGQALRGLHTA